MSDTITGTSILWGQPGNRYLYVMCKPEGRSEFQSHIAVRLPDDPPHIAEKPDKVWRISPRSEGWLNCEPSLHIKYQIPPSDEWRTEFHNGYNWHTPYREAPADFKQTDANSLHYYVNMVGGLTWEEAIRFAKKP